jgi:N-acetylmuramoyl-L-alanine amidase
VGGAPLASPFAVFLFLLGLLFFLPPFVAPGTALAGVTVSAVRVWPAEDYTRLTLESGTLIHYSFFPVKDPPRLVLDLKDVDLNPVLKSLAGKVAASDP